ncbi:MAG: hypothetical protein PT953_00190 [Prevotella sp.]|nr:hypothetical protein [Prevotella sp.]
MTDKFFWMLGLVDVTPPSIWIIQRPSCPFVTFLNINGLEVALKLYQNRFDGKGF